MSKILAVDVDLTVVDTGQAWYSWLQRKFVKANERHFLQKTVDPLPQGILPYNLSELFVFEQAGEGFVEPSDFWRSEYVYNDLYPIKGSVESLDKIQQMGWEIVFVSAIKGNHHKSKYNFLKKNFPFMKGLLATKEKQYVACHAAIDDRNHYLNKFATSPLSPCLFKYETPYTQDENLLHRVVGFNSWIRFDDLFLDIMRREEKC